MRNSSLEGVSEMIVKLVVIIIVVGLFLGIFTMVRMCSAVKISAAIVPEKGGTIIEDGNILKSVPNNGYEFDHWGGDINCTLAKIYLRKTGSQSSYSLTASFKKADPPLSKVGKRKVQRASLEIKQEYTNAGKDFSIPLDETTAQLLNKIGIAVVQSEEDPDAVISVNIKGTALGDNYFDALNKKKYYYTGAAVTGKVSLAISGQTIFTQEIKRSQQIPEKFTRIAGSNEYDTPDEAFNSLGLSQDITEFIAAVWGPAIWIKTCDSTKFQEVVARGESVVPLLIKGLSDPDIEVRVYSLNALKSLGNKAKEAVPALLDVLKDDDYTYALGFDIYNEQAAKMDYIAADVHVKNRAKEALKAITGTNFP